MKLLERVCDVGLRRHLSPLTIDCYQRWIRHFLVYCARSEDSQQDGVDLFLAGVLPSCRSGPIWRHPRELGAAHVERFLTHLAKDKAMSASSQNQAINAIVFLYKQVLADE